MNKIYFGLLFGLITQFSFAGVLQQNKEFTITHNQHFKDLSLITGYQTGSSNSNFIEIGLGLKHEHLRHHPAHAVFYLSNELLFVDNFVLGTKVGINFGANMMDMGLSMIHYTNFEENSIRFRPEIGLGFGKFRLYYGYNFALTNRDFEDVNDHLVGINILLDLKSASREPKNSPPLE